MMPAYTSGWKLSIALPEYNVELWHIRRVTRPQEFEPDGGPEGSPVLSGPPPCLCLPALGFPVFQFRIRLQDPLQEKLSRCFLMLSGLWLSVWCFFLTLPDGVSPFVLGWKFSPHPQLPGTTVARCGAPPPVWLERGWLLCILNFSYNLRDLK